MGFSKSKVSDKISIPVIFEISGTDEEGGVIDEEVTVVHHFKRPTSGQRERLGDVLTGNGRKRPSSRKTISAIYTFWSQIILEVEGYDDLPSNGNWKDEYFRKDDIGIEHVQAATIILLNRLGAVEGELIKKSDSSPDSL